VVLFTDSGKSLVFARIGSVVIDVDKTKLLRRKIKVTKIVVSEGELSMSVDPGNPQSEILNVSNFHGSVFLGKGRSVDVRGASGNLNGVDLRLDARLKIKPPARQAEEKPLDLPARQLFSEVIKHLANYQFDRSSPPRVTISLDGDLEQQGSLRCRASLESASLSTARYSLENLYVDSVYENGILTISDLHANDRRGTITGRADYALGERSGRFTLESGLDLPEALRALAPDLPATQLVSLNQPPQVSASGSFKLPGEGGGLDLRVAGHAECGSLRVKKFTFTEASTDFSWQNGDLFLRDLHLTHKSGKIDGKLMLSTDDIRFQFLSSLPAEIFQPFFAGKVLGNVLAKFTTMTEATEIALELEGTVSRSDPHQWACWGRGEVFNLAFAGVPAHRAKASLALNTLELRFEDIEIDFDYRAYPLRRAHDGPEKGSLRAASIVYDRPGHLLTLKDIRGTAWPAPVLRLFSVPLAEQLEAYRFHAPPEIQAGGVIGLAAASGATDFTTRFKSDASADYLLADADLRLAQPSGVVRVRNQGVEINDLKFSLFRGDVEGSLNFPRGDPATFKADLSWNKISLNEAVLAWGIARNNHSAVPGVVTGRAEIAGTIGKATTYNGSGLLALKDGELFSVPMFGPLTPLIAGVLGKKAGFQRAQDAFMTFNVKNGLLRTNDFQTSTTSLVFTGDGTLTLADRQLDFIMRMNARGLLGIITLPLRPFYGLFQFHGTGPLSDPTWTNVRFTKPADGDANPVFRDPPKARVVPE
jgi:hypothetical protein